MSVVGEDPATTASIGTLLAADSFPPEGLGLKKTTMIPTLVLDARPPLRITLVFSLGYSTAARKHPHGLPR